MGGSERVGGVHQARERRQETARRRHHARLGTLAELDALPGVRGYVTRTFCEQARYFQPPNGQRIDAIRDRLVSLVAR